MRKLYHTANVLMLGLLCQATPAFAKGYQGFALDRYKLCVREVSIDAAQAYERANRWRKGDGGGAAMHCEALALSELQVFPSAAKLLERLARLDEIEDDEQRAEILLQAGHAWLLADRGKKARQAFDDGLDHVSLETHPLLGSDLLIGKARGFVLDEKWDDAVQILDDLISIFPQQYDAILVRASIKRADGDFAAATRDIATYLALLPDEISGLMERGFLRLDLRDLHGAREDFNRVVELGPDSRQSLIARQQIAKIDFWLAEPDDDTAP